MVRKEDFVKFRIVDTLFYALPVSHFEAEEAIVEAVEEVIEEVLPTPEELEAIAKADKKAELMAQIALLEE